MTTATRVANAACYGTQPSGPGTMLTLCTHNVTTFAVNIPVTLLATLPVGVPEGCSKPDVAVQQLAAMLLAVSALCNEQTGKNINVFESMARPRQQPMLNPPKKNEQRPQVGQTKKQRSSVALLRGEPAGVSTADGDGDGDDGADGSDGDVGGRSTGMAGARGMDFVNPSRHSFVAFEPLMRRDAPYPGGPPVEAACPDTLWEFFLRVCHQMGVLKDDIVGMRMWVFATQPNAAKWLQQTKAAFRAYLNWSVNQNTYMAAHAGDAGMGGKSSVGALPPTTSAQLVAFRAFVTQVDNTTALRDIARLACCFTPASGRRDAGSTHPPASAQSEGEPLALSQSRVRKRPRAADLDGAYYAGSLGDIIAAACEGRAPSPPAATDVLAALMGGGGDGDGDGDAAAEDHGAHPRGPDGGDAPPTTRMCDAEVLDEVLALMDPTTVIAATVLQFPTVFTLQSSPAAYGFVSSGETPVLVYITFPRPVFRFDPLLTVQLPGLVLFPQPRPQPSPDDIRLWLLRISSEGKRGVLSPAGKALQAKLQLMHKEQSLVPLVAVRAALPAYAADKREFTALWHAIFGKHVPVLMNGAENARSRTDVPIAVPQEWVDLSSGVPVLDMSRAPVVQVATQPAHTGPFDTLATFQSSQEQLANHPRLPAQVIEAAVRRKQGGTPWLHSLDTVILQAAARGSLQRRPSASPGPGSGAYGRGTPMEDTCARDGWGMDAAIAVPVPMSATLGVGVGAGAGTSAPVPPSGTYVSPRPSNFRRLGEIMGAGGGRPTTISTPAVPAPAPAPAPQFERVLDFNPLFDSPPVEPTPRVLSQLSLPSPAPAGLGTSMSLPPPGSSTAANGVHWVHTLSKFTAAEEEELGVALAPFTALPMHELLMMMQMDGLPAGMRTAVPDLDIMEELGRRNEAQEQRLRIGTNPLGVASFIGPMAPATRVARKDAFRAFCQQAQSTFDHQQPRFLEQFQNSVKLVGSAVADAAIRRAQSQDEYTAWTAAPPDCMQHWHHASNLGFLSQWILASFRCIADTRAMKYNVHIALAMAIMGTTVRIALTEMLFPNVLLLGRRQVGKTLITETAKGMLPPDATVGWQHSSKLALTGMDWPPLIAIVDEGSPEGFGVDSRDAESTTVNSALLKAVLTNGAITTAVCVVTNNVRTSVCQTKRIPFMFWASSNVSNPKKIMEEALLSRFMVLQCGYTEKTAGAAEPTGALSNFVADEDRDMKWKINCRHFQLVFSLVGMYLAGFARNKCVPAPCNFAGVLQLGKLHAVTTAMGMPIEARALGRVWRLAEALAVLRAALVVAHPRAGFLAAANTFKFADTLYTMALLAAVRTTDVLQAFSFIFEELDNAEVRTVGIALAGMLRGPINELMTVVTTSGRQVLPDYVTLSPNSAQTIEETIADATAARFVHAAPTGGIKEGLNKLCAREVPPHACHVYEREAASSEPWSGLRPINRPVVSLAAALHAAATRQITIASRTMGIQGGAGANTGAGAGAGTGAGAGAGAGGGGGPSSGNYQVAAAQQRMQAWATSTSEAGATDGFSAVSLPAGSRRGATGARAGAGAEEGGELSKENEMDDDTNPAAGPAAAGNWPSKGFYPPVARAVIRLRSPDGTPTGEIAVHLSLLMHMETKAAKLTRILRACMASTQRQETLMLLAPDPAAPTRPMLLKTTPGDFMFEKTGNRVMPSHDEWLRDITNPDASVGAAAPQLFGSLSEGASSKVDYEINVDPDMLSHVIQCQNMGFEPTDTLFAVGGKVYTPLTLLELETDLTEAEVPPSGTPMVYTSHTQDARVSEVHDKVSISTMLKGWMG